jgi:pimeloyl-ACP methyl ester carboxylesterase
VATIALIPGGGDSALSWGPVCDRLRALGHDPVAIDLPCEDPAARWADYVAAVVRAVRGRDDLVVVGHSLGGFTAPLVCAELPARLLVLVAGMIPTPGALAGSYWRDSGYHDARVDDEAFYHDVPPEGVALARRAEREDAGAPMSEPWPLASWPVVTTRYLLCANDRCFSAAVSRRIVRERLGIVPDEIASGHCVHLARPKELAERLAAYAATAVRPPEG